MPSRLDALEARVDALASELRKVAERLTALESARSAQPREPLERSELFGGPEARLVRAPGASAGLLTLAGRTLLVLSGAYLIRALSEAGSLPPVAGAAAGLAYAAWWLERCDRSAGDGHRSSAVFHGIAAALIAYPLIWETTVRFGVLPPLSAALALLAFGFGCLAVAWRRELAMIAWVGVLFAVATALALLVATRAVLPFGAALLLLALVVERLAFSQLWLALRWPAALGANLALLVAVLVTDRSGGLPEGYAPFPPQAVVWGGLALTGLYLGSVAARTLLRDRTVTPFEFGQAALALLVGFGGAARVGVRWGTGLAWLGIFALLLGAAAYAAAFAFVERRTGRGANFYFYATLAVLLGVTGSRMLLDELGQVLAWTAAAVATAWLGARFDRATLRAHAFVYLIAAASVSGLLSGASDGLTGTASGPWRPLPASAVAAGLAGAVSYAILVSSRRGRDPTWLLVLPRALIAATMVLAAAGLATRGLAAAAGAPAPDADAALLAALRTVVLTCGGVALAWAAARWSLREAGWLVYAVMLGAGVKLLIEDFRSGRPATLFMGLGLYGGALIAVTRLLGQEGREGPGEAA